MSIEGQFLSPTSGTRRELAFVKPKIGDGYLNDIRRFEMLEKGRSTISPNVGASMVTVTPGTSL